MGNVQSLCAVVLVVEYGLGSDWSLYTTDDIKAAGEPGYFRRVGAQLRTGDRVRVAAGIPKEAFREPQAKGDFFKCDLVNNVFPFFVNATYQDFIIVLAHLSDVVAAPIAKPISLARLKAAKTRAKRVHASENR